MTTIHAQAALHRLPMVLVAASVLLGLARLFVTLMAGVGHPGDIDYPDSAVLFAAREFVTTGFLYQPLDQPPYQLHLYGPLTYLLLGIPQWLAERVGADGPVLVRLTLCTVYLACALGVGVLARRLGATRGAAVVSALLAASLPVLTPWILQARGDLFGLVLSLFALGVVAGSPRAPAATIGMLSAGLALLVKLTFVVVPVTIVAWLVWQGRRTLAAAWAMGVAAVVIAGYGIVYWREPHVLEHLVGLRALVFDYGVGRFPENGWGLLWTAVAQPVFPLAALGLWMSRRSVLPVSKTPNAVLANGYVVAAWLVATVVAGQTGSAANIFWEATFASALVGGPFLWELWQRPTSLSSRQAVVVVAVVGSVVGVSGRTHVRAIAESVESRRHQMENAAEWQTFAGAIAGHRILSTVPEVAVLAPRPELPEPFSNALLEAQGRWTSAPLIAAIDSGAFDLVVVNKGAAQPGGEAQVYRGVTFWNGGMFAAIRRQYRRHCVFRTMEVWVPETRATGVETRLGSPQRLPLSEPQNGSAPRLSEGTPSADARQGGRAMAGVAP